jgi:hypothetical protein
MRNVADKFIGAMLAGALLLGAQAARAEPMKCSGEQKTCVNNCVKAGNALQAKQCGENCRVSQANCMRSGCWANGALRYCGLMKQ